MAASVVGNLRVNLSANFADFKEGMANATTELRKFERKADRVGKNVQGIGVALSASITAPLALFGRQAVIAARDAEELQSAFDFSFGKAAESMNRFAEETGDALGRSTQELQQQAFTFNQLFKTALDGGQAAELSKEFTVLTNDLSSFFNVAEGDALQKLRAGLVGEAEPLRAFGVFLSAAAVEAKALELGLAATSGELTEQQKILARAAIILDQTKDAQGDLTRTQGSSTNTQRRFNSELAELSVIVGQELLPPLTDLLRSLGEGIKRFKELDPTIQSNVIRAAAFAAAVGPGAIALGTLIRAIGFASKGLAIFTSTVDDANGKTKSLRLNILGTATAFAGLIPVAHEAGKAVGNFIAKDQAFMDGLLFLKLQLPKALGGAGLSAKDAQKAIVKWRMSQADAVEQSKIATKTSNELAESFDLVRLGADNATFSIEGLVKKSKSAATSIASVPTAPSLKPLVEAAPATEAAPDKAIKAQDDALDTLKVNGSRVFDDLEDRLVNFARTGEFSIKGMVNTILDDFLRLQASSFVGGLRGLLGGLGGSGGLLGGLSLPTFGGGRAMGGMVMPNRTFLVGEQGPELFVPSSAGQIVSNRDLDGMGQNVTINQTITTPDPNAFRAGQRQMARSTRRALGV